ncbi:hypothetical protein CAPTEDRAFT_173272 [Capitella teleta]|uniref:Coiled-coil domain-containing protein 22 homolog n=1 Tax=Capitella teleta TaxID=283909 RepID=R7UWA2_CAPTE|nr:hypothetical protein CAPTEDRAFT_173272 [Capitella teleta]|eukprot:ELU08217.1 hypothetical protein CAPTEDRAFT_173272 [Capitella teleta]
MEEVDGIIAHTLRSIGCDVEDEVEAVAQFSTELVVEGVARCLRVINPDLDLPYKLPPSMSARFRIGTSLASAVQDIGYRGEVGYQTFLYSSEADIRRVFIFLIEKLPKEASQGVEESLGASALLRKSISAELMRRISLPWTPNYCKRNGVCWRGDTWHREAYSDVHSFRSTPLAIPEGLEDLTTPISKETRCYFSKHMPYAQHQPKSSRDVAASLLASNEGQLSAHHEWENEWNTLGMYSRLPVEGYKKKKKEKLLQKISDQISQSVKVAESSNKEMLQSLSAIRTAGTKTKASRFTHIEKLQFAQDEENAVSQVGTPVVHSEEDTQKKREEETEELRKTLAQVTANLDRLRIQSKKFKEKSILMEEEIGNLEESQAAMKEEYKVKKKTLDLLPNAEKNITDMQGLVEASSERLLSLKAQWEKRRQPLIAQYEELKHLAQSQMSESQQQLEEIQELRERMKQMAADTRTKEEVYKQLVIEYEKMAKDVNRSAYTRRILEIVSNIKKQKLSIDQVLLDTRSLQKDINQLTGKLDRTFTVTDELIFKDAKKEEAVRKAYKYLAALHENCSMLMKTVEDTGVIMREIRDLEDQVSAEGKKKTTANLEKISRDLHEMKKENSQLMAKYKKNHNS